MSALASFALECASTGRWARGMLALQSNLPSPDPEVRHAAVALAVVAAPHSLEATAELLAGNYSVKDNVLVGHALDALARNSTVGDSAFCRVAAPILRQAAGADGKAASDLFLAATQWRGAVVASSLLKELPEAEESCQKRLALLEQWKWQDNWLLQFYFPAVVSSAVDQTLANPPEGAGAAEKKRATPRHFTARDRRERVKLRARQQQEAWERARRQEREHIVAAFAPSPPWWSVATLLRLSTRPQPSANGGAGGGDDMHVSWRSAMTILGEQPLVPEMELSYIRCVGLCAPEKWEAAMAKLGGMQENLSEERRLARLWLVRQGSPAAAADMARAYVDEARERANETHDFALLDARTPWGEELLARCGLPRRTFLSLFPFPATKRLWFRLVRDGDKGAIARALASGVRLDQIQLSATVRMWAKAGDWSSVLEVYYCFPNGEMQNRAVEALVPAVLAQERVPSEARPSRPLPKTLSDAVECIAAIPHRRKRVSLGTHSAYSLIKATTNGNEALDVLRRCVRHGTVCNPQLLSAVMDKKPKARKLRKLLASYPGAVNGGIARRAKEEFHVDVERHPNTVAPAAKH